MADLDRHLVDLDPDAASAYCPSSHGGPVTDPSSTPDADRPIQVGDEVLKELVAVATYVSHGQRHIGVEPYPDAMARKALGTLYAAEDIPTSSYAPVEREADGRG